MVKFNVKILNRPERPKACNFIKKEAVAQVFSCEFCKISKNTFSYRAPPVAASINKSQVHINNVIF